MLPIVKKPPKNQIDLEFSHSIRSQLKDLDALRSSIDSISSRSLEQSFDAEDLQESMSNIVVLCKMMKSLQINLDNFVTTPLDE